MIENYTVPHWILFFYIYCFLGWVWESSYVSVCKRKFVNRGFLKGPFLPIYGSGALCILIVTIPVRGNIPLMFLAGMVSATVLEYVTGAVMERLFRVRYWDYSDKFLNVNGYICLSSTICWGVMTILVTDVFHVYIERLVMKLDIRVVNYAVLILTPTIAADFVTSFNAAIRLRDALIQNDRIRAELEKIIERKNALEAELEKLSAQRQAESKSMLETGMEKMAGSKNILGAGLEKVAEQKTVLGAGIGKMAEQVQEKTSAFGSTLTEAKEKAYAQMREELQETYIRFGEYKEKLRTSYTKSTRGLLRRNPDAVSHFHKESFAELKQNLAEKLEEIRR